MTAVSRARRNMAVDRFAPAKDVESWGGLCANLVLGLCGDAAVETVESDATDASEAGGATDAAEASVACTASEPEDHANWHVSDVPEQLVQNSDGTITENNTGLTWMRAPAGEVDGGAEIYATSFAAAEAACPARGCPSASSWPPSSTTAATTWP